MMNGNLQWIAGVLCSAAFLAADTLLEVEPGTILGDRWNRNLHQNFSTGSSKTGVEAVSENGKTIARYQPGASTLYRLSGAESCGTDNLTFTVLARAQGDTGEGYLLYAGAGSHTKPGIRLGLRAGKEGLQAYGLFVAASSSEKAKKFVSVPMKKEFRIEPGKWAVFTLAMNRAGDLQLFVNGELVASQSIRQYEKENLYPKVPLFATQLFRGRTEGGEQIQIDIAELSVRNELMSSAEILREAKAMLDSMEKK